MPHQSQSTGQIACQSCRVTLAYPIGAPSVRCPMCTAVTQVQQFTVSCVCCRCILILPQNTSLAMCPRCRTVMSIPPSIREGKNKKTAKPRQCVYIERPATTDSAGNRVSHLAVGTRMDDDQPKDSKKKVKK